MPFSILNLKTVEDGDEQEQPSTSSATSLPRSRSMPNLKEKSVHFNLAPSETNVNATDRISDNDEEKVLNVHFPDQISDIDEEKLLNVQYPDPSIETTVTNRLKCKSLVYEDGFDLDTVYMVEDIVNEIIHSALSNAIDGVAAPRPRVVNKAIDSSFDTKNVQDNDDEQEIYSEQYKASGQIVQYLAKGSSLRFTSSEPYIPLSSRQKIRKFLKQVFLPYGFPESVSADYTEYQTWDTLQAFFSTLTGALTTHAIMKGVGVGDANATAASAAITWIAKDGAGMVGRILFAWLKGTEFDTDCKNWRLFADVLNDAAMFLECLLPYVTPSVFILCISTTMKSLVGVAGGATRAALTQHQAIQNNMADVSAKDGSQESCVNLIGSFTGIFLLMTVADSSFKWDLFFFFVFCHIMCNYRAVRAVQMSTLNTARFVLILRCYFVLKSVGSVKAINRNEPIFIGRGLSVHNLCGYHVNLGASMMEVRLSQRRLERLRKFYKPQKYMLYVDVHTRTIQVFLKRFAKSYDIIRAFYHAILLAIGMCMKDDEYLFIISRQLKCVKDSPLDFIYDDIVNPRYVFYRSTLVMTTVGRVVDADFPVFYEGLLKKGWNTENLLFNVDKWRGTW